MARRSVEANSVHHVNPIPTASRVGPLLMSSIIPPRNPGADDMPDEPEAQLANLFHHVGEMLDAGGAGWEHIVKMTFFVPDLKMRDLVNAPWVEHFPDANARPARHTQLAAGGGRFISCDFVAYVE
jgi:2-iminobutanoate/2-iminopropanoate deaminase